VLLMAVLALPVHAGWEWGAAVNVSSVQSAAIFPHLESANRQGVAVSGDTVGVVWEDNRSGSPQCYLAMKPTSASAFKPETKLSQTECYEPVVVGLGAGRFVAAWEEAGQVRARIVPGGAAIKLSDAEAAQVTLAASRGKLYAAWAERAGPYHRIVVAQLKASSKTPSVIRAKPVEAAAPTDEQDWPAVAVAGDGSVTVSWEDRREHHTVPMVSTSQEGLSFGPPARLSDLGHNRTQTLGAGTGAMRPTLTSWGKQGVAAVWLDKRDFLSGYDVYAALDDGTHRFGRNIKVQDSFGDNMAQWHAKIVGDANGRLLAVWDDARDGTPDVWMANWDGEAFGDNIAVPAASGPGEQSDPLAVLDGSGQLHLVWLDRDEKAGTRIRYVQATWR
jgi:hypothetical protein